MRFRFGHRRIGRPNPKGNRRIPASSGEEASSVAADHSSTSSSSYPARSCSTSAPMKSSHPSSSPPSDRPKLTVTQIEQLRVEAKVFEIYRVLNGADHPTMSLMYARPDLFPLLKFIRFSNSLFQWNNGYHLALYTRINNELFFTWLCWVFLMTCLN